MNNRTYLIPGVLSWTFKTSDTECALFYGLKGPGISISPDFPAKEVASRAHGLLFFKFDKTSEEASVATDGMLKIDWAAMTSIAGTDVRLQTPSLPGWTLKISDLGSEIGYSSGANIQITSDTPMQEIIEGVRRILQPSLPQVEIDVQVDEFTRIDFKNLILNAWAPRVAPLMDGCTADNSAFVESICADVNRLASLQNADSTALGNEICALLKTLA